MSKTLQLNFVTASGKKMMLTVDEPRDDITTEEVESAMSEIISSGAFVIEDLPLESAIGARVVERTITTYIE